MSHFIWDDYTALNAAVGVAAHEIDAIDIDNLHAWTMRESTLFLEKFAEFKRRANGSV